MNMDISKNNILILPDGHQSRVDILPDERSTVVDIIQRNNYDVGKYQFVKRVTDPDCGEIDLPLMTFFSSSQHEAGLIYWDGQSNITTSSEDIHFYLSNTVSDVAHDVSHISLHVFEDSPDKEQSLNWLFLENIKRERLAEYGLDVNGQLSLSMKSETTDKPLFLCDLPTPRSVLRFVSISCEHFQIKNVQIQSHPINRSSSDWFG